MKLTELIRGLDIVAVEGDLGFEVVDICYDSRRCREGSLFVAVSGLKHDGHDYIGQAVGNDAAGVVLEKEVAVPAGMAAVRVRDSRRALGLLGQRFFRNPSGSLCVTGVTGTSGKTTVTFLLESIFKEAGSSVGVLGTVNYRFDGKTMPAPNTTPESLDLQRILREMADSGVQNVVMEVSSHALAQRRVDDCEFDIGVFTNLSSEHMDYHKTMEEYFLAKRRLFDTLLDGRKGNRRWRMVVNLDDDWGKRLLGEVGAKAVTFGMDRAADVTCEEASFSLDGIRATAKTPAGRVMIRSELIGRFNLSNILAAVAASYALDVPTEAVEAGIRKVTGIPGRLERVGDDGDPSVFVDYAHKEAALREVMENLSPFKEGRLITIFGCGGDRDRQKRPLMGKVAVALSEITILTSDNPRSEDPLEIIREIEKGINSGAARKLEKDALERNFDRGYLVIPDRRDAIEFAVRLARRDDIVLIAGKGHETYQIIGDRTIPFDDREVVREALASRRR